MRNKEGILSFAKLWKYYDEQGWRNLSKFQNMHGDFDGKGTFLQAKTRICIDVEGEIGKIENAKSGVAQEKKVSVYESLKVYPNSLIGSASSYIDVCPLTTECSYL